MRRHHAQYDVNAMCHCCNCHSCYSNSSDIVTSVMKNHHDHWKWNFHHCTGCCCHLTTSDAASDENFFKMTTFTFQWLPWQQHVTSVNKCPYAVSPRGYLSYVTAITKWKDVLWTHILGNTRFQIYQFILFYVFVEVIWLKSNVLNAKSHSHRFLLWMVRCGLWSKTL